MKTIVLHLWLGLLVTLVMLQGGLAQSNSGCYPQVSNVMDNARMHMEEGIYISDYVFTCSGVIRTYSLTVFQHSAVENEFWEDTLTTTVDIVGVRAGTTQPVQLGQIQVQMNHPDDDHEHQARLDVIAGNLTQEIFIQQGDYVRITTPRALYNLNEGQFINQHIPVAMVPSAEHNITRYYDCSDELNCNRMEILPLQAAISFTIDTQGPSSPVETTSRTTRPPTVTSDASNPPALVARDAVLISVIAILIILVVALSVMLTLLACRKKLKQSCLPLRKGRADVHESNAVSALAIVKPTSPNTRASPSSEQGTSNQETSASEYATLRERPLLAVPVRQPGPLQPPKYSLPEYSSTELTVSQNSHSSQEAVPEFPVDSDYEEIYTKQYYVPTMEQRCTLSNMWRGNLCGADSKFYETLWHQQVATPRMTPFRDAEVYFPPSEKEEEIYQQMAERKMCEIPRPLIKLQHKLGEGEFGVVYRGLWYSHSGNREVAVKVMRDGSTEKDKIKVLQEAVIMGQFSHQHVVKFYGILTLMEPVMMVMELLPNGDLRKHLMAIRTDEAVLTSPILPSRLLTFCHQVTKGMDYLSRKGFVHRDLAARNILLDKDFNCKIADFGMSRDLTDLGYYVMRGGQIPVKWTAPEAILFRKYSTSSDVWSLGMVFFEVWSLGWKPFDNFSTDQVINIFNTGYCQPPPPGTPRAVYSIMVQCWNPEAHDRPSFALLCSMLNQPQERLLHWSHEDRECAREDGGKLGAPLIESLELYPELQHTYKQP